jgi:hypothetical protein
MCCVEGPAGSALGPVRKRFIGVLGFIHHAPIQTAVPVGNLIRLASEAESRNVSIL